VRKRVFTAQVSFGEIFIIKGVGAFEESGYDGDSAMRYVSSPRPPIHSHSRTLLTSRYEWHPAPAIVFTQRLKGEPLARIRSKADVTLLSWLPRHAPSAPWSCTLSSRSHRSHRLGHTAPTSDVRETLPDHVQLRGGLRVLVLLQVGQQQLDALDVGCVRRGMRLSRLAVASLPA